jgi:conjugative transfer pilus assembly protein TraH
MARVNGRNLILTGILSLVFLLHATVAQATLQNEMLGMFNSMSNVTEGGYHQSMGRGVVQGPGVAIRNNRVRTDLMNFRPPSISAGCGGIDMFMGSFSFISADQFVHLMEAVATNAAGYAFKLAVSTMCPSCDAAVSHLQNIITKLNGMAGDSCKIAEEGVNLARDAMDSTGLSKSIEAGPLASMNVAAGTVDDAFKGFLNTLNTGSNIGKASAADVNAMLGNVAWKVLQRNNFMSSAFSSGDNDLAEALMSVTGTVIGSKKDEGDDAAGPSIEPHMPILKIKDLIEGAQGGGADPPKRYSCADTGQCLSLDTVDYNFEGLEKMVKDLLLGADGNADTDDSFIYKLINNTGTLTDKEKQLIRVAPYHMTRLRNMAACLNGGQGALPEYVNKAARLIALEMVDRYVKDALVAINHISQGMTAHIGDADFADSLVPQYLVSLKRVSKDLQDEYATLAANVPGDLEKIYQTSVLNCNLNTDLIHPTAQK